MVIANFLKKQNTVIFIFIIYILILSLWTLISLFTEAMDIGDIVFFKPPSVEKDSVFGIVLKGLIVAPLLETLIFQKLAYYLFSKISYLNNKNILICVISGFLFGLSHWYSLFYVIIASIVGYILMYAYLVHIRNLKKSFWIVAGIHFLVNLSALIKDMILST